MAALTVILIVMNPPLAWARDTPTQVSALEQRMSYHGMGEGRELALSLCSGHVP